MEKRGALKAVWPWLGGRLPAGKDAGRLAPALEREGGAGSQIADINIVQSPYNSSTGSQPREPETRRSMERQGGPISELSPCPGLGLLDGGGEPNMGGWVT